MDSNKVRRKPIARKKKAENFGRKANGRGQDHGTKRTIRGRGRERHNTEEWKMSRKRRRDYRRGA